MDFVTNAGESGGGLCERQNVYGSVWVKSPKKEDCIFS